MEITGTGTIDSPYIVSDWDQFLSKCSESGVYIKFSDDVDRKLINFEELYDSGIPSVINVYVAEVDFNGWELRNITAYSDTDYNFVFYKKASSGYPVFKNATFSNVNIKFDNSNRRGLFYCIELYDCIVTGLFEDGAYIGHQCKFNFCSFNILLYGGRTTTECTYTCCNGHIDGHQLHLHNTGTASDSHGYIDSEKTVKYVGPFPFDVSFSFESIMVDCYFEGTLTFDHDRDNVTENDVIFVGCNDVNHCIFAFEVEDSNAYFVIGHAKTHSVFDKDLFKNKELYQLPDGKMLTNPYKTALDNSKIFLTGLTTKEMKDSSVLMEVGIPIGSDPND